MKRTVTVLLIIALTALLIGAGLMVGALASVGFDPSRLGGTVTERTYTPDTPVLELEIDVQLGDVIVRPSTDGTLRVEVRENERLPLTFYLTDGKLAVRQEGTDTRPWYERLFTSRGLSVTVYLPQHTSYEGIVARSTSGDVTVEDVDSTAVSVQTTSGDLALRRITCGLLGAITTSGDITLCDTQATAVALQTTSGDIEAQRVSAASAFAQVTSGDVELTDVVVKAEMEVRTVSGDVELLRCDGGTVEIQTTSGDIEGTLLTPKSFDADTTSGDVRVPSTTGGRCYLRTTSGDIVIRIE